MIGLLPKALLTLSKVGIVYLLVPVCVCVLVYVFLFMHFYTQEHLSACLRIGILAVTALSNSATEVCDIPCS